MKSLHTNGSYLLTFIKSLCFVIGYLLPINNTILGILIIIYCISAYFGIRDTYYEIYKLPTFLILTENLLIGYILNHYNVTDLFRYIITYVFVIICIDSTIKIFGPTKVNIIQYILLATSCVFLLLIIFSACQSYIITIVWVITVIIHTATSSTCTSWRNYDICQIFMCMVLDRFVK
jgi:hypothetical protein